MALADDRVRQIGGSGSYDVAVVELFVRKPEAMIDDATNAPALGRRAEVLISVSGERFTGIRAIVDVQRQLVEEVTEASVTRRADLDSIAAGTFVPISAREAELARRLALARPEIVGLLGANAERIVTEYLPITMVDPEYCPSGRCVEVLFRRGNSFATSTAVVDILTQTVRVRRGAQ